MSKTDEYHALAWVFLLGIGFLVVAVVGLPVIRNESTDVGIGGWLLIVLVLAVVAFVAWLLYRRT